jgi:hypothetical protein
MTLLSNRSAWHFSFNPAWLFQLLVLLASKLEGDLAKATANHHVEDIAVLERLWAASATGEFDHGFVAEEKG